MFYPKNRSLLVACISLAFLAACKKEVSDAPPAPTPTTPAATAADKIKDSVLAYSKDIYLWYGQIPATFNARSYADPDKIMTAIRQYSTEAGFSAPVDRWSFAMKKAEWDNVSSGISGDFGLGVFFKAADDLRVKLVEKSSPAGKAGIQRGWRIVKINGSSNITSSNSNFVVDAVFNSNSSSFTFQKPDNSTVDLTLTAATYQEHPVILDSVYAIASKKIGYLAFNSFLGDTTAVYNEFSRIFSRFTREQVTDVIIDLRYNGGGYVTVQEKLANYLVPSSGNGGLMMKQEFNNKYASYNSTDYFRKQGSLNLSRLFFIVSSSTASASELLINNLKPYAETVLIGSSKTYGKPVGYFPIPVNDWYIFPVSFRTTNKNGEGSYFNGLPLNNQLADGLDKDWGDVNESLFGSAVKYITTGAFSRISGTAVGYMEDPQVKNSNAVLDEPFFKGAIDVRRLK
jgi:C-terminal processing protease CtpA/Prc